MSQTYFVFRDFIDNTYYTLKDKEDKDLTSIQETIELNDNKNKYLYFEYNESINQIQDINKFLLNKNYIKQSYNNDNITYIIYKESESLLTIRKLVNNKDKQILYIIEFENNENKLSSLSNILKGKLTRKESTELIPTYQLFGIDKVLNT
jgi:hypothetical protein